MNNNFIIHEPADEYHARSRSGEYMSSHLLADFRESPALYRRKVSGGNYGKRILRIRHGTRGTLPDSGGTERL